MSFLFLTAKCSISVAKLKKSNACKSQIKSPYILECSAFHAYDRDRGIRLQFSVLCVSVLMQVCVWVCVSTDGCKYLCTCVGSAGLLGEINIKILKRTESKAQKLSFHLTLPPCLLSFPPRFQNVTDNCWQAFRCKQLLSHCHRDGKLII